MVMYATPSDLASYLQKDLDTATATLVLTLASAEFTKSSRTVFAATTATYTTTGRPATTLTLPFRPVTAVSAIRINGVTLAVDYTLVGSTLYRAAGFGQYWLPPDSLEVDLTYGYTTVPDDVRAAVLESAAAAYENPSGVRQETIDDYSVSYSSSTGVRLSDYAAELARDYRGPVFA